MKLASLLNQDLITIESPVTTKAQAIEQLIQKMCKQYPFELEKEALTKAIQAREALGGTTFASGIAIPHTRQEKFTDILAGICIPTVPIKEDGNEIRMVVLIVSDKSSSSLYLNMLAAFLGISKNETQFSNLLKASNPNDFIELIKTFDLRVKKELTVSDIMTRNIISATPETNLKELADILYKHKLSYVPILDIDGNFIAEVNVSDVLRLGIPDYATMVGSLKFLNTFEPLEELLKNEENLKIKQIMRKPSLQFSDDTSIIEAVLELTQNKRRHIPVVKDKKVIGIISIMDILNKVLRG